MSATGGGWRQRTLLRPASRVASHVAGDVTAHGTASLAGTVGGTLTGRRARLAGTGIDPVQLRLWDSDGRAELAAVVQGVSSRQRLLLYAPR